jgi:hypothetical protein
MIHQSLMRNYSNDIRRLNTAAYQNDSLSDSLKIVFYCDDMRNNINFLFFFYWCVR